MKLKYLIGLFLIVLVSGCVPVEEVAEEEPTVEEVVEEVPEEVPEIVEEEVVGEDIQILRAAFDPAGLTVKAGATITFKNMDDRIHVINGIGGFFTSQRLKEGEIFEFTFEEAGTYEVLDSISRVKLKVIVE